MPNILVSIASRQLAVLHRYLSATAQYFKNHTMYIGKLLETDTTAVIYS